MGSVLCMIYRQQPKQPIQQPQLSPLYRLSCYILGTTTGTTCTTIQVVPVVLVVVLYFGDDNGNNLYNQESCPRCFGCRAIILGRQLEQLIQPRKLFSLCWLSCYIFRTKTGTAYTGRTTSVVVQVGECAIHPFKHLHFDTPPPNGEPPIDINVRACCRGPCAPSSWLWRAPARGRAGGGHPGPRPRAG